MAGGRCDRCDQHERWGGKSSHPLCEPQYLRRSTEDQSLVISSSSAEDAYQQLLGKVKRVNSKYFSHPFDNSSPLPVWRNGKVMSQEKLKPETRAMVRKEEKRVKKQRSLEGSVAGDVSVVAYGLNGPHFFGFGLNAVRRELENMEDAKYLAVPLTPESQRYQFVYVLPTQEGITAVQRVRAVVAAENELVNLTGCARSEGMAAFDKSSGAGRITRA